MERLEKLDTIIIEDNLNLSLEEIQERAQDILQSKASILGWDYCELKAADPTILASGHRRFEFDVVGKPNKNVDTASDSEVTKTNQPPKVAASPEAEI